jgi:death on curing protein
LPSEPRWLGADQLIAINQDLVARTGEPHGLRDRGLLESAAAKPINHWHYGEQDTVPLAFSLLVGIVRNHPFLQGNKRTALAAADIFLHLNGWELAVPDDTLAQPIIDMLSGKMSEEALLALFEASVAPRN